MNSLTTNSKINKSKKTSDPATLRNRGALLRIQRLNQYTTEAGLSNR